MIRVLIMVLAATLTPLAVSAVKGSTPPGGPERQWLKIGIPGPHGDYQVWGWHDNGQIRYQPEEQEEAKRRRDSPFAPPLAVASDPDRSIRPIDFGVKLTASDADQAGTFTTNDSNFDGTKFLERKREPPSAPSESSDFPFAPILVILAVVVLFGVGLARRRE